MRFSNTFKLSISSLATHPFRSFLAGLGVVFGVGAVVGMLAIGEGARIESIRQIQEMGVDKIIVRSKSVGSQDAANEQSGTVGITTQDIQHFSESFDNVKAVLPVSSWKGTVISQWSHDRNAHAVAVPVEFLDITKANLVGSKSRFISSKDNRDSASICLIGSRAAKEYFQFREPIGERINLFGTYFTVVGVVNHPADRKLASIGNINDLIYVPHTTGMNYWGAPISKGKIMEYDLMYVVVNDVTQIENTSRRVESYLSSTHKENDYEVILPFELMKQQEATQRIFTVVMASIASISLLVGGIGIMNIMLANIYERMKEIGTRRALGATRMDILVQFLVESVTLTAFGGLIGSIVGVALASLVSQYADMPTSVTAYSVVISLVVSVVTGVAFGSFPAWKAASLSPMEALRRE